MYIAVERKRINAIKCLINFMCKKRDKYRFLKKGRIDKGT